MTLDIGRLVALNFAPMNLTIKEIAEPAGGVVALGAKLGLSRGAVSQWDVVPAGRVIDVEKLTGIPREKLRPDLYPTQRFESQEAA